MNNRSGRNSQTVLTIQNWVTAWNNTTKNTRSFFKGGSSTSQTAAASVRTAARSMRRSPSISSPAVLSTNGNRAARTPAARTVQVRTRFRSTRRLSSGKGRKIISAQGMS